MSWKACYMKPREAQGMRPTIASAFLLALPLRRWNLLLLRRHRRIRIWWHCLPACNHFELLSTSCPCACPCSKHELKGSSQPPAMNWKRSECDWKRAGRSWRRKRRIFDESWARIDGYWSFAMLVVKHRKCVNLSKEVSRSYKRRSMQACNTITPLLLPRRLKASKPNECIMDQLSIVFWPSSRKVCVIGSQSMERSSGCMPI